MRTIAPEYCDRHPQIAHEIAYEKVDPLSRAGINLTNFPEQAVQAREYLEFAKKAICANTDPFGEVRSRIHRNIDDEYKRRHDAKQQVYNEIFSGK